MSRREFAFESPGKYLPGPAREAGYVNLDQTAVAQLAPDLAGLV
jgi:hypothetical protein